MQDALGGVQTVLVLGGASEIGLATARRLVDDRATTIILAGRNAEAMAEGADALHRAGAPRVEVTTFDALDRASHAAFVERCWADYGDIDLAIVAFGVLGDQDVAEHDADAALGIIDANFTGAVSVLIPLIDRMRAQGHGSVAVLSSVAGERARRSNFVYGASKAGLDAFCQGMGDALVGTGVRMMIVRPGFVHSAMTVGLAPAPFATTPEHVAECVARGLRSRRRMVWAPGVLRFVFMALRHLPGAVWRRLPIQ